MYAFIYSFSIYKFSFMGGHIKIIYIYMYNQIYINLGLKMHTGVEFALR